MDTLAAAFLTAVGYALVAFVWQGALIGVVAAIALTSCRRYAASVRYAIGCAALVLMAIAPVITVAAVARERAGTTAARVATSAPLASTGAPIEVAGASTLSDRTPKWIESRLPTITAIWAGGVLAGALHLCVGWWRLRRMLRSASVVSPQDWSHSVRDLAARLGITSSLRILTSALTEVPAVVGWLRPAIVVPASALAGLPAAYLDAVLAHELAHLRRRDYLVNGLQCALEVLLFYHPAVWWVSHQVRREREHCCDDEAAAACGDVQVYARALVSLEELRSERMRLALGATGGHLLHRVRRLVEPSFTGGPAVSGGLMMALTLSMMVLVGGLQTGAADSAVAPVAPVQQWVPSAVPAPQQERRPAEVTVRGVDPPAAPKAPTSRWKPATVQAGATPASAQTPATGGIDGRVIDPTGGVVPGVTVVVSSPLLPAARSLVTDARGEFHNGELKPGIYDVSLTLQGFRTARGPVTVSAGKRASVRFRLQVGELSESLTVVGAPTGVPTPPPSPEAVVPGAPQVPIRVGGDIREPVRLKDVKPVYPPDALAAGIEGTVTIEAIVSKEGTVQRARILQGVPELDEAALDAVTKWLYRPTLLNGQPVEVLMTVTIRFVAR